MTFDNSTAKLLIAMRTRNRDVNKSATASFDENEVIRVNSEIILHFDLLPNGNAGIENVCATHSEVGKEHSNSWREVGVMLE